MLINQNDLMSLTYVAAQCKFNDGVFRRRALMVATAEAAKALGVWTEEDNEPSKSAGAKSLGLARIDWVLSKLNGKGLTKIGRNQWKVN